MTEIDTLTLEIMKHTAICDVETAQETAEIIINTLGYHKKIEKISPLAIVLAKDLDSSVPSCCDINCEECRHREFQGKEGEPPCVMVKHAEALITLGWTKRELLGDTESKPKPINCADCKHLQILNSKHLYGICRKTGFEFLPFKVDTRTHTCQFAELKEAPNEPTN